MGKILRFWRVKKVVKYIFLVTLTIANFEVFLCYSNEEQYHISPLFEGTMDTTMLFFSALWISLYNSKLVGIHNKWFCLVAILSRTAGHAV